MPAGSPKLSVVASALAPDLRSAPAVARQLGFGGLQLPTAFGGTDLTTLSGTGQRDVRHLLATHEQQLVSLSVDLGSKGFGPGADIDRVLAVLRSAMAAARGLAAGVVCIDLGPLPQPAREEKPVPKVTPGMAGLILLPTMPIDPAVAAAKDKPAGTADPGFFSQVDAALFELGRLADAAGVVFACRSDLASFAALERALRAANCPWFGVDLDPVALLRDEWEPDEVFGRLGGLVRHVRVRDAIGGAGGRTRPAAVGRGDTVWPDLLARLDDAGYHGWLTVDPTELPDRPAAAAAAAGVLRKSR
ncbi:MAG: Xylose isomerase protein barrel [Phycisphaerales bacterium]|nr:Xylose isomerase protein barrel [Phycisphaerales bacterium]